MQFINLHHDARSFVSVNTDDGNGVFTGKEGHRNKADAACLVVFGKKASVMIKTVTAIGHNPNARTFSSIVSGSRKGGTDCITASEFCIGGKVHDFCR